MADLIAYTDLQTYLSGATGNAVTFSAAEITSATNACAAASSAIRRAANRTFEIQSTAADRYFTMKYAYSDYSNMGSLAIYYPWPGVFPFTALSMALPAPKLDVDDFFLTNQTIGNITVTDTINATTYTPLQGWPFNAAAKGLPYTKLVFAQGVTLPSGEGQLKVNAKWGFVTSIPATIMNAALLQASRYFKRKEAPFGIAGDIAMGSGMRLLPQLDPDVFQMVADYRRWYAAA